MSIWTHVAGIIRIDSLPIKGLKQWPPRILELLFEEGMPKGSEGPLKVQAIFTRPGGLDYILPLWGFIAITGDLRDYGEKGEDVVSVLDWLNSSIKNFFKENLVVRQGIVNIDVEPDKHFVLRFNSEENEWRGGLMGPGEEEIKKG